MFREEKTGDAEASEIIEQDNKQLQIKQAT